jgi:hypothetical protein
MAKKKALTVEEFLRAVDTLSACNYAMVEAGQLRNIPTAEQAWLESYSTTADSNHWWLMDALVCRGYIKRCWLVQSIPEIPWSVISRAIRKILREASEW